MASIPSVTKLPRYSVEPGTADHIDLVVEIDRIHFVAEVIPDGQLAGMMGHRQVPSTDTMTFDLHPQQARAIYDRLGELLNGRT